MSNPASKDGSLEEQDKVSLKELRETFYQLRVSEMSYLWTRVSFLIVLLSLFFSGYGSLLFRLIDGQASDPKIIHGLCCAIALLAIVYSIIWIQMGKGSRAFCEAYDRRISMLEGGDPEKSEEEQNSEEDQNKERAPAPKNPTEDQGKGKATSLEIPGEYRAIYSLKTWELNSCLFSTKAGPYSVSRLNVVLGIVLLVTWTVVFVTHYILMLNSLGYKCTEGLKLWIFDGKRVVRDVIPLLLFGIILLTAACNLWGKSKAVKKGASDNTPQNSKAKDTKGQG